MYHHFLRTNPAPLKCRVDIMYHFWPVLVPNHSIRKTYNSSESATLRWFLLKPKTTTHLTSFALPKPHAQVVPQRPPADESVEKRAHRLLRAAKVGRTTAAIVRTQGWSVRVTFFCKDQPKVLSATACILADVRSVRRQTLIEWTTQMRRTRNSLCSH